VAVLLGFAAVCAVADALVPMPTNAVDDAERSFDRIVRRRRLARMTGRAAPLEVLDDVHPWARTARRRDLGVCEVPIGSLAGTVERLKARQFDREWRPDRAAHDRWKPLWLSRRSGSPVAPVSVFRAGGAHWVRDGHHRVSVARNQGALTIEADVVELVP
jgi:hypothetical protein